MDTLSSPIPNLQVPKPFNPNHHHHHHHNHRLKPTTLSHYHHHSTSVGKTTATSSISTLQQKDNFTPLFSSYPQKRTPSPPRAAASVHRKAASGYAAALMDISQSNGTVLKVEKDVRRLQKLVFRSKNGQVREFMRDVWVEEESKGKVVKELIEKGKFDGNLVGLVKMLINKGNSVELVKDVLEEFLYVFHQLTIGVAHAPTPTTRLAI